VIERLDPPVAERRLDMFGLAGPEPHEPTTARLMLVRARDDYRAGMAIADALLAAGVRDEVARPSERAAALMIYCYDPCGRPGDAAENALSSAAELALDLHQYGDAVRLCDRATRIDPLREVAWRVPRRPQAARATPAVVPAVGPGRGRAQMPGPDQGRPSAVSRQPVTGATVTRSMLGA
jgi:hypothetical protein